MSSDRSPILPGQTKKQNVQFLLFKKIIITQTNVEREARVVISKRKATSLESCKQMLLFIKMKNKKSFVFFPMKLFRFTKLEDYVINYRD